MMKNNIIKYHIELSRFWLNHTYPGWCLFTSKNKNVIVSQIAKEFKSDTDGYDLPFIYPSSDMGLFEKLLYNAKLFFNGNRKRMIKIREKYNGCRISKIPPQQAI